MRSTVVTTQPGVQADPLTGRLPGRLRLGTRRSALAMTQSQWVADQVTAALALAMPERDIDVELVEVTTHGDVSKASLASLGGTGVFVSALREALLDGRIDFAVHSLKDLPTAPADGVVLAALPPRVDPRDVLIARDRLTLSELPAGATVGTGSPRRAAQIRALGLGIDVVDVRGNVDTRIRLVTEGRLDAIVLARAGLLRLGRADEAGQVFEPMLMLPAPGQGALAIETRSDDLALVAALALLDDAGTRACVLAERALLARLEAGCAAPVGALGDIVEGEDGPELSLRAFVGSVDGEINLRRSSTVRMPGLVASPVVLPLTSADAATAVAAGRSLAEHLLADGAAELITEPKSLPVAPPTAGLAATAREGDS